MAPPTEPEPPPATEHSQRGERRASLSELSSSAAFQRLGSGAAMASARRERRSSLAGIGADPGAFQLPPEATRHGAGGRAPPPIPAWMRDLKQTVRQRRADGTLETPGARGSSLGGLSRLPGRAVAPGLADDSSVTESLAGKPEFVRKQRKMNFRKEEAILEACGKLDAEAQQQVNRLLHESLATKVRHYNQATSEVRIVRRPPESYQQGLYRRGGDADDNDDSDSDTELEFVRVQQELKDPRERALYASSTSLLQQSPPTASRPPLSPASPSASPKSSDTKKSPTTAAKPTSYQLTLIMKFRTILAGKLDDATRAQVEALLLEALVEEAVLRDDEAQASDGAGAAAPVSIVTKAQNLALTGSPSVAKALPRQPTALEQRITTGQQRQPQQASLDDEGSLAGKPEFIKKFRKMNFAKNEYVLEASGCNVFGTDDEPRPTTAMYTSGPSAGRPQHGDSESMMHASVRSINPMSLNDSSRRGLAIGNTSLGSSVKATPLHQSAPILRYDRNPERTTAMNDSSTSFSNSLSLSQAFSTDNLFGQGSEKSSASGRQSEVLEKLDQSILQKGKTTGQTHVSSPIMHISSFGETSATSAVSSISASKVTALAADYSAELDMSELLFEQDEEGTGSHHNEAAEYIKARTLQAALETGHLNDSDREKVSMQLDMILSSQNEPESHLKNEPEWRRKFRQMKFRKDESIVEASKGIDPREGDESSQQNNVASFLPKRETKVALPGSATPLIKVAPVTSSRGNVDSPVHKSATPADEFQAHCGVTETTTGKETIAVSSEVKFKSDPVMLEPGTKASDPVMLEPGTKAGATTEQHTDARMKLNSDTDRMDVEGVASFGDFDLQPRVALDDDGGSDFLEESKTNKDALSNHIDSPRTTETMNLPSKEDGIPSQIESPRTTNTMNPLPNLGSPETVSKPEPPGTHLNEVTEQGDTSMTRQESYRASKVSSSAGSAPSKRADRSSRSDRRDHRHRSPGKSERKTPISAPHHRSDGAPDKPRRHSSSASGHHEGRHERRVSQSTEHQQERRHSRNENVSSQSRRTSQVQSDAQTHKHDSKKSRPSQSRRHSLDERTSGSRSSGDSRSAVESTKKSKLEDNDNEDAANRHLLKLSLIDRRSTQKTNDRSVRDKERSVSIKDDMLRKSRDDRSLKSKESHDTRTSTEKESSCGSSEQKKSVDETSNADIVFSPVVTHEHVRPIKSPPSRRKEKDRSNLEIKSPSVEKLSRRSSDRGMRDSSDKSSRAQRTSVGESSRLKRSGASDGTQAKRSSLSSMSKKKEEEEVNVMMPVLPMDFTEFDEDEEDDLGNPRSRMSSFDDPWADAETKPSSDDFGAFAFSDNFGRMDGSGGGPLIRHVSSGSGNPGAHEKLVGKAGFDGDFDLSSPGASLGSDRPVPKRGLGRSRSIDMSPVHRDNTEKSRRGRRSEHLVRSMSAFESNTAAFEFTVTKPPMGESSPSSPSRNQVKTTRSRDKSRKKETTFDTYDWTMS